MAGVGPDEDEEGEIGAGVAVVDVVEHLGGLQQDNASVIDFVCVVSRGARLITYSQEEITDIVGEEDANTHVSEVKPIATPDEGNCYDVVEHEFFVILSWLFQSKNEDNGLLQPERGL